MISMKLDHKEETAPEKVLYPSEKPEYPYGLRLHLEEEQIKKLGIAELPTIDSEMHITAKVKVCSLNMHASSEGEHRSLGLQVIEMSLGGK